MTIKSTLTDLQINLKKKKLDGFLVSHNNIFIDQSIRTDENIIQYLTGFSGSAGTLLIRPLPEKSILFVDGRYELQAPQQTNPKEIKVICTNETSFSDWINQNFTNKILGFNSWCWSINTLQKLTTPILKESPEFLPAALTDKKSHIFEYDVAFCGLSREEKISQMADYISKQNQQAYFISSADSVSWLLNLRSDILSESPVFRAYALIDTKRHIWIFTNNADLQKLNIKLTILPLESLPLRLKKFKKQTIGCDFNTTPTAIVSLANRLNISLINTKDYCQQTKAIKNQCELEGIRQAHIRDAIAMCKFLYWLDNNWQGKTELDIVDKLHQFRSKQDLFFSESFATISASGSNSAIVHYSPTTTTNKYLEKGNFLLLDSGAQYFDGTTDITRTIPLGSISAQMCDDFTLVLKAHINLSSNIFPKNTTGSRLDALARQPLWQEGKNYNHGTGHGIGCFLNVHEGPQYISASCNLTFSKGQITSIEPGYYLPKQYGIRIENIVEVCETHYKNFLCFKNLTLVPIDIRAINKYLLSQEEIAWLNKYHQEVFNKIAPHLTTSEKEWLATACAPL